MNDEEAPAMIGGIAMETEYAIIDDIPRVARGNLRVPEAYARAEREWNAATALYAEQRFDEAAGAFMRAAESLSPALAAGYRAEFFQARAFAYANAAAAWASAGLQVEGRRRLASLAPRDGEERTELNRAMKLLG